jgi:hypothetical protein
MFLLTLSCGVAAVVAVALSPVYVQLLRIASQPRVGGALVASSAGLALVAVLHRQHPDGRLLFLAVFALFLTGALLLVADGGDDDGDDGRDEPPWWPEFESDFRRYAARPRRPLSRV